VTEIIDGGVHQITANGDGCYVVDRYAQLWLWCGHWVRIPNPPSVLPRSPRDEVTREANDTGAQGMPMPGWEP